MAYDEPLAGRVRRLLEQRRDVTEKKMFGGLSFLLDGKMCCGILREDLVVRVGREREAAALRDPHARAMDFTGRPMPGMVYVSPAGCRSEAALRKWVQRGVDFAASVPPKPRRARKR